MKLCAPAAERNKAPILEVLRETLPRRGLVLEVASGSGQHAAYFAGMLPKLIWQPSDHDPGAIESIAAYVAEARLPNLLAPLSVDATQASWPLTRADAIICINMIHIAPWEACLGLLDASARLLPPGAPLVLYGPYRIDGDFSAESNVVFDERLRSEDPRFGVRELRDIEYAAQAVGLGLESVVPRPANNHVLIFRRQD